MTTGTGPAGGEGTPAIAAAAGAAAGRTGSGSRTLVVVTLGTFAGHAGNYLFYVLAARILGPVSFAEVSALVAFATLATQPYIGVQAAAARDVAKLHAVGMHTESNAYLRRLFAVTAAGSALLLALLLALSVPLASWLDLESPLLAAIGGLWIVAWGMVLVGVGAQQGSGRFGQVAWLMGGPLGLLRTVLLVPLAVWFGTTGSMLAMFTAAALGLVSLSVSFRRLRELPTSTLRGVPRPRLGHAVITLLAFASLTNADVLIGKATLAAASAGIYSSAVLLGKIALFAPLAIAMVLLPRAAAAVERGEDARPLLGQAHLLTATAGLVITAAWWVLPDAVVELVFGSDFLRATQYVLPLSGLMTGAALLNVGVSYALAARDRRFTAVLVGAAVLHVVLLVTLGASPVGLVIASALGIGTALVLVEAFTEAGLVRSSIALARSRRQRADV